MEMINKYTRKALNCLTCFLSGKIDSYILKTCLFGPVCSNLSPVANIRDNNYNNRLALEDVTVSPIRKNAISGQSEVDKKRRHTNKASNAKRGRYDVPPAEQEAPPVYDYHYHQRPGFGCHSLGYE
jgi:hypothetical protein